MNAGFWRGRNALVTGAGGFVGSWLAETLTERGANVTTIMRDRPRLSNFRLLGLEHRVNIVNGSIEDVALVERALSEYDIDTCYHLAAQAIVGAANSSPVPTFQSNIAGTWSVLEACRRRGGQTERVIVASSDKAYGTQPRLPYTEDMPLLGLNPYDASKACTDALARTYHHTYGLRVAVARCANIYGGGDLNFSRLVPGTVRSALLGERPAIRSDGTPVRDYLHVDDAVAGYVLLADAMNGEGVAGQAFNFGSGSPVSVLDLVRRILEACGRPDLAPAIQAPRRLHNEIDEQYLDSSKAARVLGWAPIVTLDEGLERAAAWYRTVLCSPEQAYAVATDGHR